jgi:hypothetical protein
MCKMIYLNLTITVAFLFLLVNLNETYSQSEQQQQPSPSSPIELTAKLVGNEYRWIGSNNSTNPTLNITSGVDNQITVKSIQGDTEEHELIIKGISAGADEEGEELVKGDEVEDGSSTIVNFYPSDAETRDYQSLEYYCEYHPDTMRGKVQIK